MELLVKPVILTSLPSLGVFQNRVLEGVFLTQYCAGGKNENNVKGGACGAYAGGEREVYSVLLGKYEGNRPLENPEVNGR
jgi:hypothetical protein